MELTPESRELLEGFTQEGIETGVVAGGFARAEPGSGGMASALFEGLLASVREAARRIHFDGVVGPDPANERE